MRKIKSIINNIKELKFTLTKSQTISFWKLVLRRFGNQQRNFRSTSRIASWVAKLMDADTGPLTQFMLRPLKNAIIPPSLY